MHLEELKRKPLPAIPEDIQGQLPYSAITLTVFEDKNSILKDPSQQQEVGYRRFPDGSYLVSMYCPMPGITPEMIAKWFWWHAQADKRYQVWFPGEHYGISYPLLRKVILTEETARGMAEHCCVEYRNLAKILPELYKDFASK